MAIVPGSRADLVLRDEQVHLGIVEAISQNINLFNAASANCIRLVDEVYCGDYENEISWATMEDFVTRRDVTSTTVAADGDFYKISEINEISVKLDRKLLIRQQEEFFRRSLAKMTGGMEEFSNKFAQNFAMATMKNQVNGALKAVVAAITGQSSNVYDATGDATKTPTKGNLNLALAKLGDMRSNIRCIVMHSNSMTNLITDQLGTLVTNIADFTLRTGGIATFGLPYLVTDSASLQYGAASPILAGYWVIGLVEDGVRVTNSNPYRMYLTPVTGQENATFEMRWEGSHNVRCKGLQWDTTNGGANPTDSTLGTTTNWDKVATSAKHIAGVALKVY